MKLTLNLASRSYVNERALRLGCLVLTVVLLLLILLQVRGYLQSREENLVLQAEIATLEQQLKGKIPKRFTTAQIAVQQQEFARAEEMLKKDAFRWTVLFERMEKLLPANVSIRSFNPDYREGGLRISGVAKTLTDLQQLLDNLHADSFEQVFLKNQNQVEINDYAENKRPVLAFIIELKGVF